MKFKIVNGAGETQEWKRFYLQANGDLYERCGRSGDYRKTDSCFVVPYIGFGDHYLGENGITQEFYKNDELLIRTKIDILDELLHQGNIDEDEYDALCDPKDQS